MDVCVTTGLECIRCNPGPCEHRVDTELEQKAKMLQDNIKIVERVIRINHFYPCDKEDLLEIGTVAMLHAINTYDANKFGKFESYAHKVVTMALMKHRRNFDSAKTMFNGCDGTGRQVIPYNTKIRYRREDDGTWVKCFCGNYDPNNDTYNVFRGWDLHGVPSKNIEVFQWLL